MTSNPTLSWERLQDKFYRNFEGYPMQWDIKLEQYIVASAPFGGALALVLDPTQIHELTPQLSSRGTSVLIYSGSGRLLKSIPWDVGPICAVGWTEHEQLVVVASSGATRVYTDFEGSFQQTTLGRIAETDHIVDCRFFGSGFVARFSSQQFVLVHIGPNTPGDSIDHLWSDSSVLPTDALQIQVVPLGGLPAAEGETPSVKSWTVVPPDIPTGRSISVLVSTDSAIISIGLEAPPRSLEDTSASKLAVSPSAEFVAYLTPQGLVSVVSADFQTKLCEYKSDIAGTPRQMAWCGSDAVALVWDDEITLVGPYGGSLSLYFNSSPVHVFTEIDGLRTLTSESHDFFTKVPEQIVDVFKLGSTSPAAILRDCIDQLDRQSPKADENLLIISNRLAEAVDSCIEAASLEFEPSWQKKLLRAAAFGKAAIENAYNSDRYVLAGEYLRVLNNVRQFDVGLLMSYTQLLYLGPVRLLERLLMRRMHLLAFKCAEFLHLPTEKIYVHWACAKIRASPELDDHTLCKDLLSRLNDKQGIAYERIARTAFEEGRKDLAIVLIEKEPQPDKQVSLLLTMQQDELALSEAVKSGDPSLVFFVMLVLRRKLPLASFFRLINDKPLVCACFQEWCHITGDSQLLSSFYYQDDRRLDNAQKTYVENAVNPMKKSTTTQFNFNDYVEGLAESKAFYQDMKDRTFEVRAIEEQAKLLGIQQQLETKYDQPFVGLSVTESIATLCRIAQASRAAKLKDEFRVPDKRFWWIRLQVFVTRRDWAGLQQFAASKKSPIGYEPFFSECLKAGSARSAAEYIPMCTTVTPQQRIDMYIQVDDIQGATIEATKAKDVSALQRLKELATPAVAAEIEASLTSLGGR